MQMVGDCSGCYCVIKQMYTFFSTVYFVLLSQIIQIMLSMNDQMPTRGFQTVGNYVSSKYWKRLFTKENADTKNEMLRRVDSLQLAHSILWFGERPSWNISWQLPLDIAVCFLVLSLLFWVGLTHQISLNKKKNFTIIDLYPLVPRGLLPVGFWAGLIAAWPEYESIISGCLRGRLRSSFWVG